MVRLDRILLAIFAFACIAGSASATPLSAPQTQSVAPASTDYVGDDTCTTCHEAEGKSFHATLHGKAHDPRTPAAAHGCETCHGAGKAHAESGGDRTKIADFSTMKPAAATAVCAECHNRGEHAFFESSTHAAHGVACTTCHSAHNFKSQTAQLRTASEVDTCATCHRPEAMKVLRTMHMPLREGKMACSSCHNPHGSSNVRMLRAGNSITESCTSCHAAQRGPFLWEHPVGRDTCAVCHDPHGSSNNRMLIAKPPLLCQRCHVSTRHPSTIYDLNAFRTTSGNRLFGRGCVECHQNVHGSNHPSGTFFLR